MKGRMAMDGPDFSVRLKHPLEIRGRKVANRLCLAPMTGLGHIAFRELVAGFGGHGLLFSEMCSATALPRENRRVSPVFKWRDEELPYLVCQLLGDDPTRMAAAAIRVEDEGFFGVDINMGCAVARVCKKNCGAALLKNPDLAVRIVERVRQAVSFPLFVKFRTGWSDDPEQAAVLANRFEQAGADALTFHPRIAPDRRSRQPKWDHIRIVKERVSIPVFGNGNVFNQSDGANMMAATGCDGIALGRIAIARPWVFARWTADGMPVRDRLFPQTALRLTHLLDHHFDPVHAVKLFKKFAIYFSANFLFAHDIFRRLCRADTTDQIRDNIEQVFKKPPALTRRPNMNLFTA
jgi:tRNA-dihydrouridine synthase B